MGSSENILHSTLKKIGHLDKMTVLNVLLIVVILACVSRDLSYQELGWPIFLESVFGLTQIYLTRRDI